ncbi:MAG: 16S rRNA (uracil(1498)-N(3))-methyltransferase [Oligoflexales bacterium]
MKHLFCCFAEPTENDLWKIEPEDVHHLHSVLRHKVGDEVLFMDGKGVKGQGSLAALDHRQGLIKPTHIEKNEPQKYPVALILGALKPKVLDELLPTLNELGVDCIIAYRQKHSPKSAFEPKVMQRWLKILQSSSKQCKRSYVPQIWGIDRIEEIRERLGSESLGNRYLLQEDAPVALLDAPLRTAPVVIGLGSESGMPPDETDFFKELGFQPAHLGPNVLRAVTAATAALTVVSLKRSAFL